jgi:hypothetical protein
MQSDIQFDHGGDRMLPIRSSVRTVRTILLATTFSVGAFLQPTPASSQSDGDPVALGTYRVLRSDLLGEDRVLQVHLPDAYASGNSHYPVVYLFYSDWVAGYFAQVLNDLYLLTMDRMPEVILVGVPNTQRYRDLLPWPRPGREAEEGHADRFLGFVRQELIPFVDREYRTKPYRIMVGPQTAAVFGAYTLLEAPGTFHAFVLNDPCQLDGPQRSLCEELAGFARTPQARTVYFAVSHDSADRRRDPARLEALRMAFTAGTAEGFRWRIQLERDWPFFLAPVDVRGALLDLFADYPFPSPSLAENLAQIRAHYDSASARLGFPIEPPNLVLTLAANGMMERTAYPAALEALSYLVKLYPTSLNGPWNLANLHRLMGDTATAIRYYEDCLRRDPNMVPAREWLRRLRDGG